MISDQRTEIRRRITGLAAKKERSLASISREIGRSDGWLSRVVVEGRWTRRHDIRAREIDAIAAALGTTPEWLRTGTGIRDIETKPARDTDIPLYRGVSVGGAGAIGTTEITESVAPPSFIAGVPDGFAARMLDDRCAPRYRHGDVLYFNPGAVPEAGDGIAVELLDGRRFIGVLIAASPQGLTLQSLQPNRTLTVEALKAVGREVGVIRR